MPTDGCAGELQRCVEVNERVRRLSDACSAVSMLSFNAMLAAERAGSTALGFGEVSRHMGHMTEELTRALIGLGAKVQLLVALASTEMRTVRALELLELASAASPDTPTHLRGAQQHSRRTLTQLATEIADTRAELRSHLGEAWRASQMGLALARSSRIEASHTGRHAEELEAISTGFEAESEPIYELVRGLRETFAGAR